MDGLPIRALLSYVENHSESYREVHPSLLCLIVTAYPQLFNVSNLLTEEEQIQRCGVGSRTHIISAPLPNSPKFLHLLH